MGSSASRNSACPCGSGQKYKRCCLAHDRRAAQAARFEDAVGRRIQNWSSRSLEDEIGAALEQFVGPERTMDDEGIAVFATWFHNDREVSGGGTPAERYASLPELAEDERAAASRIAGARLGLHRVVAVEPGRGLVLEDILCGTGVRVGSENVSREAVLWDVLLGRVMDGDPPSLWGPTRFFEPSEEPELIGELHRLAGRVPEQSDQSELSQVLRSHSLELIRFRPPSWSVEPSFFTLEGDPLARNTARWRVPDPAAARHRLRDLGGLDAAEPLELTVTVDRGKLVGNRPELPPRAIVIEAGANGDLDSVPIATLRLFGDELQAEAMSEERLDRVIEIVAHDFRGLADLAEREVVPVEQRLNERRSAPRRSVATPTGLTPAEERRVLEGFMTERLRKWLDEPQPELGGYTPREAVSGDRRAEALRLVRGIENGTERARRRGAPYAEVGWIRDELGVGDELAA